MAERMDADDIRKELESQIAELRKEIGKIGKTISSRGGDLYENLADEAADTYEAASRRARGAAKQVRNQAHVVSEAIRENPGTAATVLSSAGVLGFLIGLAVGQALSSQSSHRRWY